MQPVTLHGAIAVLDILNKIEDLDNQDLITSALTGLRAIAEREAR